MVLNNFCILACSPRCYTCSNDGSQSCLSCSNTMTNRILPDCGCPAGYLEDNSSLSCP